MNRSLLALPAVFLTLLVCCVHPKAYSPTTGRIRTVAVEGTAAQLERGRYLAHHVAVCVDCHSRRDWDRLAGPIRPGTLGAGGEEFGRNYGLPGTFYAKNITPAALKDWSDTELLLAFTAGVSKAGKPLFPLMPYHNYGKMDEYDARAILAYLRKLEPIANPVPDSKPIAPVRLAMRIMPHKARFRPIPEKKEAVAYGRYLVTMAGCADCHTQRTMGNLVKKKPFGGGTPVLLSGGTVRSANLTPDAETGLGAWTKQDFIRRFKTYDPAAFNAPHAKDGFNTVMPWSMYAGMTEEDLGAIYEYLRTLKPVRHKVDAFTPKKNS